MASAAGERCEARVRQRVAEAAHATARRSERRDTLLRRLLQTALSERIFPPRKPSGVYWSFGGGLLPAHF